MSQIEVPVRLVFDIDDESDNVAKTIASIIRSDGTLTVAVCPTCFSIVPTSRLQAHMEQSS